LETNMTKCRAAAVALTLALAAAASPVRAQTAAACPAALRDVASCYHDADANGANYWIAIPHHWNHALVVHAHGGPRMTHATNDDNLEDLERFAVTVRQGYAWAGSAYRRPGYGVLLAAQDTDNLRALFVRRFGRPQRVFLHGQSWGGNVGAMVVERYAHGPDGKLNYDGALLTSGMLAGGTLNYLHRADLRAVYQYYCNNHPRPDEPQYPVWMGLPPGSTMTAADLTARVNQCLGLNLPDAGRTEVQKRRLAAILAVVPVPERTLQSQLNWATFTFRDMVERVGGNPFDNRHVTYTGSQDDAALNRDVQRFDADPAALARLAQESDPSGDIGIPVMTMHAIDDPTALVEYEAEYRRRVDAAGRGDLLVQTFTREHEHSKLADPEYAALFDRLDAWVAGAGKPTAADVAKACEKEAARFGGGCHFDTAYQPGPLFSRVAPRAAPPAGAH
jgi:hypothetical protein